MLHKFLTIKESESQNYLNSGYNVVKNVSNDWIYLTNNLHYVRKNTVVAVGELDASLEKQEAKGLIVISRPSGVAAPVEVITAEPEQQLPKKSKKASKAEEVAAPQESQEETTVETAPTEEAPIHDEEVAQIVESTTESTDNADENKAIEVQETA